MFENYKRKRRIGRLCREHARSLGLEKEYMIARAHGCPPVDALQEWDLLTDDILMKIKAEYNQLIDIELPPPHGNKCFIVNIEGVGLTLRISERTAAAAPPPKRTPSTFRSFIIDKTRADSIAERLHALIDGTRPKTCALAVIAAIEAGIVTQPTYRALHDEFPEIGPRTNYAYYLSRPENYRGDIDSLKKFLQ